MHPGILIILLFPSLYQHCLIKGAENEDSDALWTVLLDLHSVYCGETDVCHMANYTEPSPDLFPLPCCVPCSCSATCESNQNCCPSRMRFKSVSGVTTTSSDTDKRAVMTVERKRLDNTFNTSIEKLHRDSDSLNGDNVRHTNKKMSRVVRKPTYSICENKDADQLRGNAKLISAFVFATWIVQSLYFLNPKFQASSHPV